MELLYHLYMTEQIIIFLLTVLLTCSLINPLCGLIKLGHDCARFASFGVITSTIRLNSTGQNWQNVQNL